MGWQLQISSQQRVALGFFFGPQPGVIPALKQVAQIAIAGVAIKQLLRSYRSGGIDGQAQTVLLLTLERWRDIGEQRSG